MEVSKHLALHGIFHQILHKFCRLVCLVRDDFNLWRVSLFNFDQWQSFQFLQLKFFIHGRGSKEGFPFKFHA